MPFDLEIFRAKKKETLKGKEKGTLESQTSPILTARGEGSHKPFNREEFESLKRTIPSDFDPLAFKQLKENPESEFEDILEQGKNAKNAQIQQQEMAKQQAEAEASNPENMNYEQAKEFFKENKPQTIEEEQQVNALLKQKKKQSTGELDYEGQDISRWTFTQTKSFFKDNPPKTLEEEALQNTLLKKKKESLQKIEDELSGDKRVEPKKKDLPVHKKYEETIREYKKAPFEDIFNMFKSKELSFEGKMQSLGKKVEKEVAQNIGLAASAYTSPAFAGVAYGLSKLPRFSVSKAAKKILSFFPEEDDIDVSKLGAAGGTLLREAGVISKTRKPGTIIKESIKFSPREEVKAVFDMVQGLGEIVVAGKIDKVVSGKIFKDTLNQLSKKMTLAGYGSDGKRYVLDLDKVEAYGQSLSSGRAIRQGLKVRKLDIPKVVKPEGAKAISHVVRTVKPKVEVPTAKVIGLGGKAAKKYIPEPKGVKDIVREGKVTKGTMLEMTDEEAKTLVNPVLFNKLQSLDKDIQKEAGLQIVTTHMLRTQKGEDALVAADYKVKKGGLHRTGNASDEIFRTLDGKKVHWSKISPETQTKIKELAKKHELDLTAYPDPKEGHIHLQVKPKDMVLKGTIEEKLDKLREKPVEEKVKKKFPPVVEKVGSYFSLIGKEGVKLTVKDIKTMADQYAVAGASFSKDKGKTIGMARTFRPSTKMKLWEDMTARERITEFTDKVNKDFKVAEKEIEKGEISSVEYFLDRALDPLDSMSGVYKVILKKLGAEVEGNKIKLPPELQRQIVKPIKKIKPSSILKITRGYGGIDPKKAKAAGYPVSEFKRVGMLSALKKNGQSMEDLGNMLIEAGHILPEEGKNSETALWEYLEAKMVSAIEMEDTLEIDTILQSPEKYGMTKETAIRIKESSKEVEISHGGEENQERNKQEVLNDLRNIHPAGSVREKKYDRKGDVQIVSGDRYITSPATSLERFKKRRGQIAEELESRGFIDYRERKIANIDDVVDIAVTFRHPKIEQFQIIYLKDNVVVGHRVVASGSPNQIAFKPAFTSKIEAATKKLNADAVYIAHNHPSEDPTPSNSDLAYTYLLNSKLKGLLKGHIVTNGGTYSLIDPAKTIGVVSTHSYKEPKPDYREGLTKINNPGAAFQLVKSFMDGKKASILFLDSRYRVISIDNIDPNKNVGEFIKQAKANLKASYYVVTHTSAINIKGVNFPSGMVDYVVMDTAKGDYSSILVSSTGEERATEVKRYLEWKDNSMEEETLAFAHGVQFKMADYEGKPVSLGDIGKPQPFQAKRRGVELAKEPETTEKINKTKIINWIENVFKVPIRGKATHRWRALGVYYGKKELIRLAKWGDLEVAAHEVAHHIDNKWKIKSMVTRLKAGEIAKQELEALDYKPDGKRIDEGFAEFIRHYLTTGQAETKAPAFYKYFTESFLPKNPGLESNLTELKKKMDIWQKQGAKERIIQHIDWKGEHTTVGGFKNKVQKAKDWVLKNWNDEFYLVEKIEKQMGLTPGKNIRPSKDPFTLMTYLKSKSGVIARTMVTEKAVNMKGEIVGPGLTDILKPIENKDMKTFISYAVARRTLLFKDRGELSGKHIESGIDVDDAEYIYNKYYNKSWDDVINEMTDWSNNLLNWVIDAGGLTGEEAQMIRRLNPIYLPFKRAFIDEVSATKGIGGLIDRGAAVKGIKGSGRPILNPIESLIAQATEMIAKSHKIRIASSFADLANEKGVGGFITKVPAPMEATKIRLSSIKNIKSVLEDLGLGVLDEKTGESFIPDNLDLDKVVTAFTQGWQYKGKDNIVSIVRDGKREFYEIHPDFYKALSGIDHVKLPGILKVATGFARLKRLGATGLKVSFGLVRNPFRDAFTYAVFSKNPKATIFDPIRGMYREATSKEGDLVWRFKRLGGNLSGMMGYDRAATMATYDEMMVEKLKPFGKILKVAKHPIDSLRGILSFTEMAPRVEELTSSYNRYIKENPDWTEEDAFIAAFNDAQDVTVNFTKSGYYAKRVNEISAFFNVGIRGPEKTYRSFREDPARMFTRGLLYLTIPSILLWWRNRKKQWYKNLPPSYKYNNFFIETGENIVVRLPIPFELGIVFSSLPLAGIDILNEKDPEYVKGLVDLIEMQILDPIPSILGPMIDVGTNRDFLGRPIESAGMQYLPKPERKRKHTTGLAISSSKFLNAVGIGLSPIQIDYMINNYTGGWTRQLPHTIKEAADIPILGDILLRMPQAPKRQLNSFYADWEYLSQKKQIDTLTAIERKKYYKNKVLYGILRDVYFKNLRKYHNVGDTNKVRQINEKIQEKLEKYGYE